MIWWCWYFALDSVNLNVWLSLVVIVDICDMIYVQFYIRYPIIYYKSKYNQIHIHMCVDLDRISCSFWYDGRSNYATSGSALPGPSCCGARFKLRRVKNFRRPPVQRLLLLWNSSRQNVLQTFSFTARKTMNIYKNMDLCQKLVAAKSTVLIVIWDETSADVHLLKPCDLVGHSLEPTETQRRKHPSDGGGLIVRGREE